MQNLFGSGDFEKVELFISGRKLKNMDILSKSDPQVRLFIQSNGQWVLAGKTEMIKDNLNPNFTTTFTLDFIFEVQQHLRFQVIDIDGPNDYDEIGIVDTTLGHIMGAKNQTVILDIRGKDGKSSGKLIIRAEKCGVSRNIVYMQWSGVKLMNTDGWFDKTDPFLRFFKCREGNDWLQVHETEVIMNNLNPIWKPFEIKDDKLCGSDELRPIKVECWDWEKSGKFQYVGVTEFTLKDLKEGKKEFTLYNAKKKKKSGTLKLLSFTMIERPSFIDYIRGGDQLNVITAIDFTGSNGHPNSTSSLHYINPMGMNEYQKAIHAVLQILLNYDWDQQVPVFGFGGKPRFPNLFSNVVSHCFPCNGNVQDPNANGLDGIMQAYSYALKHTELSGPTYFAPIISEAMKLASIHRQQGSGVYTILLILTDGEIHDMKETIELLVKSAALPLSIIIVGVGNADFTNMEILDGDQGLYNSRGERAQRDLVQFVPFRQFNGDMNRLARAVLAEVPDQLVDYNRIIGRKPNQPKPVDITQMGFESTTTNTTNNMVMNQMTQPQTQLFINFGNQLLGNIQQQQQPQPQLQSQIIQNSNVQYQQPIQFVPQQNPLLMNIGTQLVQSVMQDPNNQQQQQTLQQNIQVQPSWQSNQQLTLNSFGMTQSTTYVPQGQNQGFY